MALKLKMTLLRLYTACCSFLLCTIAFADVTVTAVDAHQRYPWNGLVDIVVTVKGSAAEVAITKCIFAATNCLTGVAVPITSITPKGTDTGSGTTWTRRFIWDAANDVGTVKIDDLAFTVDLETPGVQLWEDGPYWSECNVGASKPEEYGYYFWWGDIIGYVRDGGTLRNDGFSYSGVTWVSSGGVRMSSSPFTYSNCMTCFKSVTQLQAEGYIDSTDNLVATHDAATVHWGAPWRMPTDEEFSALVRNCNMTISKRNGVNGWLVNGKESYSSKSIFLPFSGSGYSSVLDYPGTFGYYWSSTPQSSSSMEEYAWGLYTGTGDRYYYCRRNGQSVRPLREFTTGTSRKGVTTHLMLDCRADVRECSADGEVLRYDASWYESGDEVRITDNGTILAIGTFGTYTWHPEAGSSMQHILKLEVLFDGQIVHTETVAFEYRPTLGVKKVEACQRYPWNGMVDIAVTIEGQVDEVSNIVCCFAAVNMATQMALPIAHITRNGNDSGSGAKWIRRFVWDAASDVGTVKIDDLSLTVEAKVLAGVQLWENGPYWAECNVGASKPEEYGYYFWWGDTVGCVRNFDNDGWISVKDGSQFSFSPGNNPIDDMYNHQLQACGYTDLTDNLVPAYDAATAHLGAPWRMPTDDEFSELVSNCTTTWTLRNGTYGRLVTGKGNYASKSIFLPAAGVGGDSTLIDADTCGAYWSSTPQPNLSSSAFHLYFRSGRFGRGYEYARHSGQPVRPLRGFADNAINSAAAGVTTRLKVDCCTDPRTCSANGELLYYDADWYENCSEVRITENGTVITTGTAGVYIWHPEPSCLARHVLKLEAMSNGQIINTETAEFECEAALAHSEVITIAAKEPTCTKDGCTKGSHCDRCNMVLSTSQVLAALGHAEVVTTVAREATCMEAGCTKGSYCSRCKATLAIARSTAALGHAEVVTTIAHEATCTEAGCTKGSMCSRCNAVLAVSETIQAGHLGTVTKTAVEPTSVAAGSTAEIRCSRCNELIQASEVIPALGYVRNVKAQQLWPHNKVALEYTVAEDVGELGDSVVSVWCAHGSVTNRAKRILGDLTIRAGVHQIVWDMEADGLKFEDTRTAFGVNIQELGGVQLWENGPYWAECNIGASKPEEYGYYFWWGDTVGYKRNAANNGWVSVGAGKSFTFTASNCPTYGKSKSQLLSDGCIDSRGNLVADQDSATAHMGVPWRMPTDAELAALIKNCTTTWTARNGVYGRLVTGKGTFASKSIFLPSAGYGVNSSLYDAGSLGMYWSSSPYSTHSESSAHLNFYSEIFRLDYGGSYCGHSVRPLRIK